ncbi:MAG: response regulator [Desulfohalobiaceae bacterium]
MSLLRVLIVEDNEDDALLLQRALQKGGFQLEARRVESAPLLRQALQGHEWDLIISDYALPGFSGLEALQILQHSGLDLPFIVFSGTIGEDVAVETMKAGAHDYIMKDNPARLIPAVRRELQEAANRRERLQEQKALQESESRFRRLAANVPDLIYRINLRPLRHFEYLSPACTRILGYTPEELYQNPDLFFQRAHPEDLDLLETKFSDSSMEHKSVLLRWMHKQGHTVWLDLRDTSLTDSQGNCLALEGIARDITEQKKTEQEKASLHAQLLQSQKMEAIGQLAGGVAHDFNNMLQAILSQIEMALQQTKSHSQLQDHLLDIRKSALRSSELTRQLLAFARKQTISPQTVDLNTLIPDFLKMLQRLVDQDITLHWEAGSDQALVYMDPAQLDQILINLTLNARDAMSSSGKITIKTEIRELAPPQPQPGSELEPGQYVLLQIEDNGSGMDQTTLEQIFVPFFTTKSQDKGTGLGLAVVYGIIKQNQGTILTFSQVGQGTKFDIYLPCSTGKDSINKHTTLHDTELKGQETVLLVEDEQSILELITDVLQGYGYTVLQASSPQQALYIAASHQADIHLIVTDVMLPQMDGGKLLQNIKEFIPQIKALYISGYPAEFISRQGVLQQGVKFLQKPFSAGSLALKVRQALQE